jgi:hypothetical protein
MALWLQSGPVLATMVVLGLLSPRLQGEPLTLDSGADLVQLVELYTSEGCSSCPPADRWLADRKHSTGLWRRFVPVAFHVDYWDYIGWTDRFASPLYGLRQQRHVRAGGLGQVYTPAFVVHGEEWRGWFRHREIAAAEHDSPGPLVLEIIDRARARVTFRPRRPATVELYATVAVLGFDLFTEIEAGENRGRRLNHDFVVLGTREVPMPGEGGRYAADLELPEPAAPAGRYAYVAWVSAGDAPAPLQAVGGWADAR